jgi:hypothetical protein
MVEERLRAGNLRRPCEDEQQRQQAASGDGYDGGTYGSFSLGDRVLVPGLRGFVGLRKEQGSPTG